MWCLTLDGPSAGWLLAAMLCVAALPACDDDSCSVDFHCEPGAVCSEDGTCVPETSPDDTGADARSDAGRDTTTPDTATDTSPNDTRPTDTSPTDTAPDDTDASPDTAPDVPDGPDADGAVDTADAADTSADTRDTDATDTASPDTACASGTTMDLAGTITLHEATRTFDSNATLGGASVWLLGAATMRSGSTDRTRALTMRSCDSATRDYPSASTATTANWSFADVGVDGLSEGIAAVTDDAPGQSGTFITTATAVASPPLGGSVSSARAVTLTERTEQRLSFLAASDPDSGINGSAGDLVRAGFVLLRFTDPNGDGVSGVTVTRGGSPVDGAIYPNDGFNNATDGTDASTASHGVAFVPKAPDGPYSGSKSGATIGSTDTGAVADLAIAVEFNVQ